MRKLFTLLAAGISFGAAAQSWYIKPTIGAGRTGQTSTFAPYGKNSVFFKGEFAAGIEKGRIRVETGVGYVNPGYRFEFLLFEPQFVGSGPPKYTDIEVNFDYIYVPVRAAYKVKVAGGLSIIPSLGIAPSYNVRAKEIMTTTGEPSITRKTKSINKLNAFADAMMLVEYKVGPVSVTAGASYKHMVNNTFDGGRNRLYLLSGDAGILYHF